MEKIHNIPVDFAKRMPHKIDVTVNHLIDYEYSKFKSVHSYPSSGSVRVDLVISTGVTVALLIIIAAAIILVV